MDGRELIEIRKIYQVQESSGAKTIQLNVPSFEKLLESAEQMMEQKDTLERIEEVWRNGSGDELDEELLKIFNGGIGG